MINSIESPYTDGKAYLKKEKKIRTFRKEEFQIVEHYYECESTKKQFTNDQIDKLNINQVYNAYRSKHGFLFPKQISNLREKYGLNHTEISKILGLGVNMIRNYENGEMPSLSNATLLNMIKSPAIFKELFIKKDHFLDIKDRKKKNILDNINQLLDNEKDHLLTCLPTIDFPNEFTGYIIPNFKKFAHICIFFLDQLSFLYKVKLNKLLFYTDFYHFKQFGKCISGNQYAAIEMGPVPDKYLHLFALMVEQKLVEIKTSPSNTEGEILERMVPITSFQESYFTQAEIKTLNFVLKQLGYKKTKEIVDLSHTEDCWKELNTTKELISYTRFGFDLKGI